MAIKLLRFTSHSFIFKRVVIITFYFLLIFFASDKIFDFFWNANSTTPLTNLYDVYKPPQNYDNIKRVNLKLIEPDKIVIEGDKKIKSINNNKNYDFYDTVKIIYPQNGKEFVNKIFFEFEKSTGSDSIFIVITESPANGDVWNQIFYSSVFVSQINNFSNDPIKFRINYTNLVDSSLLNNNDSLINQAITYFNASKDSMAFFDCGENSRYFKYICDKVQLPCRIIFLQGGDANESGLNEYLGYPIHVVCEIYSSRFQKWFVADPTYGFIFKLVNEPLSAVEISDLFFFRRDYTLKQDTVFFRKRPLLGRDYFKYYENIFYFTKEGPLSIYEKVLNRIVHIFYNKFTRNSFHYTNEMNPMKSRFNYILIKSVLYLIIILVYINFIIFILLKRLYLAKRN